MATSSSMILTEFALLLLIWNVCYVHFKSVQTGIISYYLFSCFLLIWKIMVQNAVTMQSLSSHLEDTSRLVVTNELHIGLWGQWSLAPILYFSSNQLRILIRQRPPLSNCLFTRDFIKYVIRGTTWSSAHVPNAKCQFLSQILTASITCLPQLWPWRSPLRLPFCKYSFHVTCGAVTHFVNSL